MFVVGKGVCFWRDRSARGVFFFSLLGSFLPGTGRLYDLKVRVSGARLLISDNDGVTLCSGRVGGRDSPRSVVPL